jgi:hypothetical protein
MQRNTSRWDIWELTFSVYNPLASGNGALWKVVPWHQVGFCLWSLWSDLVPVWFKTAPCSYVAIPTTAWRHSTVYVVLQLLDIIKARKGSSTE